MKFGLMSYNDHWITSGKRKGVDLGKNLDLDIVFLKLQISEVMANYHWDDFFSCLARWWFQIFFIFTPTYLGNIPILTNIFQLG